MSLIFHRLTERAYTPCKKFKDDVGFDLRSLENEHLQPGEIKRISTGLQMIAPEGYYIQLMSRSSLAEKKITVEGGVIDNGYRGQILILLRNDGSDSYDLSRGDKVAQLVLLKSALCDLTESKNDLKDENVTSERGDDAFGSTGK